MGENYQAARLVRRRRVTTFPASCPGSLETKSKLMIVHTMAEPPPTMICLLTEQYAVTQRTR